MIEKLENPYISFGGGAGYMPNIEEIIAKINEIIRYLNEKEDEK